MQYHVEKHKIHPDETQEVSGKVVGVLSAYPVANPGPEHPGHVCNEWFVTMLVEGPNPPGETPQ